MNFPRTIKQELNTRVIACAAGLRMTMGIMLLFPVSSIAEARCTAPPALRARLQAKPTAQIYSDVGTWFADRKQFECAADSFASASRLQPQTASFAYLWGLSLYSAGQDADALEPLGKASQLDPSDIRPHLVLGAALDRVKKNGDAENEWRSALVIDPQSAPALDGLSQDLLDEKDYVSVAALLDKSSQARTRTPLQSLNLGVAYAGMGRIEKAASVLREGLNDNPDSLPIADELSQVLMLQGREEEAYAVLEHAVQMHPDDQTTQVLYLRTLVSSHSSKAPEMARKLLARYPNQWEVLYLNGFLETAEGNFQVARTHLENSIAQKPDYFKSREAYGNILANLNDLAGAKEQLEKAIGLGDDQPEVEYSLAMTLKRLGDTAEAQEKLSVYQRLKKAQTDRVQAAGKSEEGDQAWAAGDAEKAASLYREALETDPGEPLLYYKLSRALDKMKDIAGETAALEKAIQLTPNLAEAQNQMGYLAIHGGDTAGAENFFRAAVHASPSYIPAWINLAAAFASEARWQDAKEALGHALEIAPDDAQARQMGQAITAAQAQQ